MTLREVLLATGQHRFWQRLADEHVDEGVAMPMRGADEAYVSLRLGEMYLARSRKLWRKYHPLLNGLLDHRGNRHQVIADASRFPPFATDQLDRVAVLKHRLAGPVPYAGDDLTLAVALLSVPGADAAQALLATLTDLAALPALATGLDSALKVARAVEQGVDRLLALDQVQLQLGILDTWAAGEGFRAGFYVGIAADENAIDGDRLWVQDGRLRHGEDPVTARAYGAHDYMVVQVEASEHRTDWPLLGDLAPFDTEFKRILGDSDLGGPQLRAELARVWTKFVAALAASADLIASDRELIAADVADDLERRRIARDSPNPFVETRSLEGRTDRSPAAAFDFAEIAFQRELGGESRHGVFTGENPFG